MNPASASRDPWVPVPHRIRRAYPETADVVTLDLIPEAGPSPPFAPGQFNMLYVFGQGEAAISIGGGSRDVSGVDGILHTVRAVGPVTRAMQRLDAGDTIGLRGPFGRGWPVAEARGQDLLVIAGGLGLAPLRALMEHVLTRRGDYGDVTLLYGARSPQALFYREQFAAWRRRGDIRVLVTVDHAGPGWNGEVGTVTQLLSQAAPDPDRTVACLCGPEVMMRFTLNALLERGLRERDIFLSMERHMQCALGYCGHCLYGPLFVCRDGPVFRCDRVRALLPVKEL